VKNKELAEAIPITNGGISKNQFFPRMRRK